MAFFQQAFFLLKLLLRLKSWRFALCVLPVACLVSNTFIYSLVENLFGQNSQAYLGLATYGAADFVRGSRVVADTSGGHGQQVQAMLDIVASRQADPPAWLSTCQSKGDCDAKYFHGLQSTLGGEVWSHVSYDDATYKMPFVSCLLADNAELGCPYIVHLVAQSLKGNASADSIFKDVNFLSLVSQQASSPASPAAVKSSPTDESSSVPDSICNQGGGALYNMVFPTVLMIQLLLVSLGLTFYIILGNVSCISRLKRDGFLQLMFQNGLSVKAYWSALWFVTILEMAVFGVVIVLAYSLQCPGFYSAGSLFLSFAITFMFGIFLSSLGYMFSSLIKSYFYILLLMILVNLVALALILTIRLGLDTNDTTRIVRSVLLVFPLGHIAEFLVNILPQQAALTGYPLAIFILSLLVSVLLVLLGLYLDFLFGDGNGFRLPASFPFSSQFWHQSCTNSTAEVVQMREEQNRPNIEPVEEGLQPLIYVRDVDKIYRKRDYPCSSLQIIVALKSISCTIYDGQITALIGHNGAGKTTLLKILIGEENSTTGTAIIDGRKATDPLQRQLLRGRVGICHQTNVLCSDLTVMQCIELVLVSRGCTAASQRTEVSDLLSRLDLDDKVNVKATNLSGGQKRKLCTLLALIGNPKVIFLDEPTSGLDPVSRRRLWQILQEYKTGRAIVLCTQFMDEADILADRKIFLSSGSLICAGSSLFLKHAFGCGFVLNVSLKLEESTSQLMGLLRSTCPAVRLKSQFRTELELMLPSSESEALPGVVRTLETQPDLVDAFGLSQATLDDIFMRLKDVNLAQIESAFQSGQLSSFAEHHGSATVEAQDELQKLLSSQANTAMSATAPEQFGALMKMNLTRLKRAKLKFCCRFIFPAILLLLLVGSLFLERTIAFRLPMRSNISAYSSQSYGVCIRDEGDPSHMNATVCSRVFRGYSYFTKQFSVISKNRSTDLFTFLLQPDVLQVFNSTCGYSSCAMAYSSSWSQIETNRNRSVHLGLYQTYRSSFSGAFQAGNIVNIYSYIAAFFNATTASDSIFLEGIQPYTNSIYPFMGVFTFMWLYSLIPVTYISDPLEDKDSKVRYQLASMGMGGIGYWLNTFLLHWCQYAVFTVLSAILHAAIVPGNYANAYFLAGLFVPTLIIGCASNQLSVYAIGCLLKKPNPAVTVIYFFTVFLLSFVIVAVQFSSVASIVMIWVVPPFATISLIFFGLKVATYALTYYNISSISDIPDLVSIYFSHPYVLQSLIATIVHIVLLMTLVAVMENRSELAYACCRALSRQGRQTEALNRSTDAGVKQEADRIGRSSRSQENILEVTGLEKKYGNGVKAVKGVTFGSMPGEIFGLLGPNGAGKTTTLSIVVGEEVASGGSCEVCFHGAWMAGSSGATNGAVGYSPQHNPLFDSITVMEHLHFYARIRGVPSAVAAVQIPNLANGLGLAEHKEKQAEQLSGGNKRRLCLAISLLGSPSLVVIDEASTGVDPEAKRFIWSAIRGMANNNRSVVVTTHSMEEVEALCSRVGIMNRGLMIAFGTIQQLRSRYGHAYTLDILLSTALTEERSHVRQKMQRVIAAILDKFPQSQMVEELFNRVQFLVPQECIGSSLSDTLTWLTANQPGLGIQYFTFYQMSLDQVFVRLIKEHEDVKGVTNGGFDVATDL